MRISESLLVPVETSRLNKASDLALGRMERRHARTLERGTGVYKAASESLGNGYFFDEDGVSTDYWLPGMAPGASGIKPNG